MSRKMPLILGTALLLAGAGPQALAQQQPPKPEQLVKWRQSAYQVVAWNNGRIKAALEGGSFNADEVRRASGVIAALANANLGLLFAPGTEKAKGWRDTAVKPELFTDGRVGQLATDFSREATSLAQVAQGGDAAAVREAFGRLGKTCKACHDAYKLKD